MIIEFNSSPAQINESLRNTVCSKLNRMKDAGQELAKAEVFFGEKRGSKDILKICEVDLMVSGASLFVHRESGSYEDAFQEVLDELAFRIELKKQG